MDICSRVSVINATLLTPLEDFKRFCIYRKTRDPKGLENVICTMMKYRETIQGDNPAKDIQLFYFHYIAITIDNVSLASC